MFLSIIAIIAGLVILIFGAEGLVRGASSIATNLRISALVIGLTVVSFGTSAPELTVNILSAIQGAPDLAVGNIVGSNIANVLFILGVCAIIIPLTVKSSTVWKEIPLALLGSGLLLIMVNDIYLDGRAFNALTRIDGFILLALMIIFMYYVFGMAKSDRDSDPVTNTEAESNEEKIHTYPLWGAIGLTIAGLAGLVIGGRLLVTGAIDVAETAGLSEALIGLTIVAIGTSLPELATSVVAALRKHADIAIGNVVGSTIFNIFFVLGTTSVILPLPISGALNTDIIISVVAVGLLLAFTLMGGKRQLVRWQGIVFVVVYIAYLAYLVMRG